MIGGQRCIRCDDLWLLPALVYVMGGATSTVPIGCIEHIVHLTGTGRCVVRALARSLVRVFTPARDSGGLEQTPNDATALHTADTWVGRTVSARAGSQSELRKATTGWRAQPMRQVLGRDNGQWDTRKTWARGFPHMLTLVKWREKRARRDTNPWYERSAVRAEAGLGLLLLLLLLLLRGVCWEKDRAPLLHSGTCCLCFTLSEVSISDAFILSFCGGFFVLWLSEVGRQQPACRYFLPRYILCALLPPSVTTTRLLSHYMVPLSLAFLNLTLLICASVRLPHSYFLKIYLLIEFYEFSLFSLSRAHFPVNNGRPVLVDFCRMRIICLCYVMFGTFCGETCAALAHAVGTVLAQTQADRGGRLHLSLMVHTCGGWAAPPVHIRPMYSSLHYSEYLYWGGGGVVCKFNVSSKISSERAIWN